MNEHEELIETVSIGEKIAIIWYGLASLLEVLFIIARGLMGVVICLTLWMSDMDGKLFLITFVATVAFMPILKLSKDASVSSIQRRFGSQM